MQVTTDICNSFPACDRRAVGSVQRPTTPSGTDDPDEKETVCAVLLHHPSPVLMTTPPSDFAPSCSVPETILSGLLALLIAGLAPQVQAQSATSPSLPDAPRERTEKPESTRLYWKDHFDDQIAHMLRDTRGGTIRTALLHTVINVAINEGDIDVSETVPSLLHIVKRDEDPQRRLLALQALDLLAKQTGSEIDHSIKSRLYNLLQEEPTAAVRRAGVSVLKSVDTSE